MTSKFHDHCSGCCARGRCHFCLRQPGTYIAHGVVGSSLEGFDVRFCGKHAKWLTESKYAPLHLIDASEIVGDEEVLMGIPARSVDAIMAPLPLLMSGAGSS